MSRLPLLLALLLPPLLLWPMPRVFTRALVSSPQGEAARHLWGWWAALAERAPLHLETQRIRWPDGATLGLIDPIQLPVYALGDALFGPMGAYNLVCWLGMSLCGLAGWALARQLGADEDQALLGLAAGLANPGVVGAAVNGMSEELGVAWVILQLVLLLRLIERPGPRPALALSLALAAVVYSGPYNAVWTAFIDVPVALYALRRTRWPLAAAALALLLAAPYLHAATQRPEDSPGTQHLGQSSPPPEVEAWRGAWGEGTDLLDLVLPLPLTGTPARTPHSGYMGLVLISLALLGAHRRGLRASAPWLLGSLGFASLALGPWTSVGGEALRLGYLDIRGPAYWLERFTPLALLTRWYRAGAVASMLLLPLASVALRGRWAWLAALTVLLDLRYYAPHYYKLPTLEPSDVELLRTLKGPIAELPNDHTQPADGFILDENILAQVIHEQTSDAMLYPGPGGTAHRMALNRLMGVLTKPPGGGVEELRGGVQDLRVLGVRSLLVWPQRLPDGGLSLLKHALGPPELGDHVLVWSLEEREASDRD